MTHVASTSVEIRVAAAATAISNQQSAISNQLKEHVILREERPKDPRLVMQLWG
jgi:hypothetical protein